MKGFIEVTVGTDKTKHLISVNAIKYVYPVESTKTEIALACSSSRRYWSGLVLLVKESYDEVKSKIAAAMN